MNKAPSFQFYPADWLKDIELRACSISARGLWVDMLCLMHQSKKYGYLTLNGKKMEDKIVSKLTGISLKSYLKLKDELIKNGVARLTNEGMIYSFRMVKDERLREIRREAGKLGGSPLLKQEVKQEVKQAPNQKPTPSSSSSSSSSLLKETYISIFEIWNEQGIVKHKKLTDEMKEAINGCLKNKAENKDEIIQAIKNYKRVWSSDKHWLKYSWTLVEFLRRGFEKCRNWETANITYKCKEAEKPQEKINTAPYHN